MDTTDSIGRPPHVPEERQHALAMSGTLREERPLETNPFFEWKPTKSSPDAARSQISRRKRETDAAPKNGPPN